MFANPFSDIGQRGFGERVLFSLVFSKVAITHNKNIMSCWRHSNFPRKQTVQTFITVTNREKLESVRPAGFEHLFRKR